MLLQTAQPHINGTVKISSITPGGSVSRAAKEQDISKNPSLPQVAHESTQQKATHFLPVSALPWLLSFMPSFCVRA